MMRRRPPRRADPSSLRFFVVLVVFFLFALTLAPSARAHGDDTQQATGAAAAPRAEGVAGPLELVALYRIVPYQPQNPATFNQKDTLALFVSRYADGAPVRGAKVSAATELEEVDLTEADPGVYVTRDLSLSPGRNDLRFTVVAQGAQELSQSLSLLIPGGAVTASSINAPAPAGRVSKMAIGLAVGAVYLCMMGVFLFAHGSFRLPRWIAGLRSPVMSRGPRRPAPATVTEPVS